MSTRVLIIDDHPIVGEALVWALTTPETQYDVTVACTLSEGVECLRAGGCELVLLDLGLPGCSGIEALLAVREAAPDVAVAVVSGSDDCCTIVASLQAGANGFIPKIARREVMIGALRLILEGGKYVPPEAVAGMVAELPPGPPPAAPCSFTLPRAARSACEPQRPAQPPGQATYLAAPPAYPVAQAAPLAVQTPPPSAKPGIDPRQLGLTGRQTDVLWLMLNGLPNKLICRRLQLAEGTVKVHVSAVLRALGVHSRTQAVVAAGRLGLRVEAREAA